MTRDCVNDSADIAKDDIPMLDGQNDEVNGVLDELIEMFIKENKRVPTEDEMKQWINVFKSLSAGGDGSN